MVHYFVNIFIFSSSADFSEVFRERPLKKLSVCSGALLCTALPREIYSVSRDVKSRLRRLQWIWRSDLVVRFLPLSFYAKKKVAERKARIRGIAPRFASLLFGAVSPFMYSPYDCSADSDLTSYRPKRSASIMPRVSYFENARIKLGFFPYGKYAHPLPQ